MSKLNELYNNGGPIFKRLYELEADTNAFTDAEKAELDVLYGVFLSSVTAGGTVNAITANFTPDVTLTDRMTVVVRAIGANDSATVTFSPDGLTAKNVRKLGNRALVTGDIEGAGHELLLKYNSTNDVWELMNPARPDCVVEDEVTGAAVTSIDFTGLDINTDKSYRIELDLISAATGGDYYLYYNNDTTATNYHSQFTQSQGGTVAGVGANTPAITNLGASTEGIFRGFVSLVNGYAVLKGGQLRGADATIATRDYSHAKTSATVTNITQLTITSATASQIDIGTKVRIYRG